jgi:hypothetical protein
MPPRGTLGSANTSDRLAEKSHSSAMQTAMPGTDVPYYIIRYIPFSQADKSGPMAGQFAEAYCYGGLSDAKEVATDLVASCQAQPHNIYIYENMSITVVIRAEETTLKKAC